MKKLIALLLLLAAIKPASAQYYQPANYDYIYILGGIGVPVIDNKSFDNWSETNYHRKIYNNVEGMADLGFALKNYDLGIYAIGSGGDYQLFTFYFGRRVTSLNSPITSYLNLGFGGFSDQIYSLAPEDYPRTPDEVGQHMYLRYSATFLTLQSKNFINSFSFNISHNRKLYFRSGFYVNLNYRPWNTAWEFGYDRKTEEDEVDDDGNSYTQTNKNFTGTKVYDVPALANKFMDVGAFMAISWSTSKRKGFYGQ